MKNPHTPCPLCGRPANEICYAIRLGRRCCLTCYFEAPDTRFAEPTERGARNGIVEVRQRRIKKAARLAPGRAGRAFRGLAGRMSAPVRP